MPRPSKKGSSPVFLIHGGDEFSVAERGAALYRQFCEELGGEDHETIDATAANSEAALRSVASLREALETLPFFGDGKAVWFRNCTFLGDERAASTQAVSEALGRLVDLLQTLTWDNLRLVITSPKVDKRRTFYKSLNRLGAVEQYDELTVNDAAWVGKASAVASRCIEGLGKSIAEEALSMLVAATGPNLRQLRNEAEKAALYIGDKERIQTADVEAIVSRNKQARAFALGDALGARDVPALIKALDEDLWETSTDRTRSTIGVLYGIVFKVRAMILAKALIREGWIRSQGQYNQFKTQLSRVPSDRMPTDRRFNPLSLNPYVLFRAALHAGNYQEEELVEAMDTLLSCNRELVSSGLEDRLLLQRALVGIAKPKARSESRRV